MGGKVATYVGIECHECCDEETIENREHQQRVFGRFAASFRLVDQQTCVFRSRFRFRRCPSFDVNKWSYESDLELDLLAAQPGSGRQGRNLGKGTRICSAASTSAERCSDRCPALPHKSTAFSICPASVQ